jgi:hypothetical protein
MRLRDLPDWPGGPGGARDWTYKVPTNEQAMLNEVMPPRGNRVTFKCEFEGKPHTYDLEVTDAALAASIAKVLRENIGRSVMEIGELDVPEETDVTEAEYEEATIRASHHDEERNRQTGYDIYFPDEPQ